MMHRKELLLKVAGTAALACMLLLVACSSKGKEESDAPAEIRSEQNAGVLVPTTTEQPQAGWKEVSYEEFVFTVPADWTEESGTGVWFPGTESFAMGMPDISLQCGAMPIMPGQTVDGQIKEFLHGTDSVNKMAVNQSGMSGHIREAKDEFGLHHLALTLEEQAGGGMIMVHFFNCRVPASQYDEYEDVFRRILDSVRKS